MDPRHPEQAIDRMDQLMAQFKTTLNNLRSSTVSSQLAQLEREGGLVVQEICLVAPRLHEAMMQTSRQRRHDLSRGNVYEQMRKYAATAERVDEPVEKPVEKDVNEKPKKKTTRKKKTAKKADK